MPDIGKAFVRRRAATMRRRGALAPFGIALVTGYDKRGLHSGSTIDARVADTSVARVVLLGTGTPIPDPERSGPSLAIVVRGASYLVDAGPGVVRRATAVAARDSIPALRVAQLRHVFLTHLHS